MTIAQKDVLKLRDKLREHNPSIDEPQLHYLFLPTGCMMNLEETDYWKLNKSNRDATVNAIFYAGCSSIMGKGLAIIRKIGLGGAPEDYGCYWRACSPDFLKSLNEINEKNIYELAKKIDVINKTKLIIDSNNTGDYFWIPKKDGDKTICEACSIVTPFKKENMPKCSLRKIFGDDFRIKVVTPKELSENILKPWINRSLGPFPEDLWKEIKTIGKKTESFRLNEYRKTQNSKNREVTYRA